MTIKGLSKYDITDENGVLKIWSRSLAGHSMTLWGETSPAYRLRTDDGKNRAFSKGFIRFLMRNPDIDARDIHPLRQRIKFAKDGSVLELYPNTERGKRYSVFEDVDDVLTTALAMKAASNGDLTFIYDFIHKNRERAINAVASLLKTTSGVVRPYADEGEELFVKQIQTARCERIIPLYAWLCRCIKCVTRDRIKHKNKNIDTIRTI